ncbi:MAG: hypothetical protein JWR39_1101 [Devosia sp.]|nr:hypothetical protein [Devosia sp.]
MPRLLAVCLGQPQPIPGKKAKTGIFKAPVSGPVAITPQGLAGDAVLDRRHHGGADQAAYLYFADDYAWWAGELGAPPDPGTFGENLVLDGIEGRTVAVGDRFGIGVVALEVTSHRTPCFTFSARMGDRGWAKRFHRANRPGAYCRVLAAGALQAGTPVDYTPFAGPRTTVSGLMALDGVRDPDPAILRRALQAPLHHKLRSDFEARLARLF